jgi:23S rRNA (guanosine2251-2'-O)-methyltransferase
MSETIVGRKPVIEALKAGMTIEKIVLLAGIHGRPIDDVKNLANEKRIPVHEVSRQQFRLLASDQMTQGVVAVVPEGFKYSSLDQILDIPARCAEVPFLLILDEIEDPHNLGALIRTAECAGVHGVIVPKHHSAPINSAVVKASAGAAAHIAVAEVTNIVNTIEELKEKNYWVVGLDGNAEKSYGDVDYTSPIALVVGNEGKGIRRLVKEHCDFLVKIPIRGKIESLNASVAGALVMFEVVSQRMRNWNLE